MGFGMGGFDFLFSAFPVLFLLVFVLVIGVFIVSAVRGVSTWSRNNRSPRLTVAANVVAKRTEVTYHRHDTDNLHTSSTWYYVTFQVDSGDRMEFSVSGPEFGLLAEGDRGSLTFQGSRYLSFERT